MRCGKMKILKFSGSIPKPFLFLYINVSFLCCNRSCSRQISVICVTGYTDQLVFISLIEKRHRIIQTLTSNICILDHRIIHGIRNPAHIPQIILQVDRSLVQQLPGIFYGKILCLSGKLLIKHNSKKTHTAY